VLELLLNFLLEDAIVEMDTIIDLIETETITETEMITEEAHATETEEVETEIETEETKLTIETETGEVEGATLTHDTVLPSTPKTASLFQTSLLIVHGSILKITFVV